AAWQRHLATVRRLAPRTTEAYGRDLGQFIGFLAGHTGGPVGLATLRQMRGADIRAWLARRRRDDIQSRSLARALSAVKSFLRYLEQEGILVSEALNAVRPPRQARGLPRALTVLEA